MRDITAERRSQSHIQELQAELAHVARLSTMGQMASAIAHELNQPLTAVSNYAGALSRVLASGNADPDRVLAQSVAAWEIDSRAAPMKLSKTCRWLSSHCRSS